MSAFKVLHLKLPCTCSSMMDADFNGGCCTVIAWIGATSCYRKLESRFKNDINHLFRIWRLTSCDCALVSTQTYSSVPYFPEHKPHFEHSKFAQKKGGAAFTPTIKLTEINRTDVCISWQKRGGGGGCCVLIPMHTSIQLAQVDWGKSHEQEHAQCDHARSC